ncbi:MAG: trypsin-like peptidase domain-containing protein [Dehalococcoidia bacterium]|nr:MAG: trypsin-like peptidase domain-containing protein [Dehalococcoidia bacterium]
MVIRYSIVSIIILSVLAFTVSCTSANTLTITTTATETVTSTLSDDLSSIDDIETTLEVIYAQTNPSVVYIEVSSQFSSGSGSGFVWDKEGNIVTNNHVVDGAENITVVFSDGTITEAEIIGQDTDSDLAVIKVNIDNEKLKPVIMADSTQLRVGQLVIAIGNPYGYQGTLTVGYISGLGRVLPTDDNVTGPNYSIPDIIQTDAAINPGNSGGVLLDNSGGVIGVTFSIVSASGSSAGIGFVIPSAIVIKVVPSLISTGSYRHPYLGILISSLIPEMSEAMNLAPDQRGALIREVTEGSPADNAGLRAGQEEVTIDGQQVFVGGDVIIKYDDKIVSGSDELITLLARYGSVGDVVTLTVIRDGNEIELQVILGARPD